MTDLNDLIFDDHPTRVDLVHPETKEELGFHVLVASEYSNQFREYVYSKVQAKIDKGEDDNSEADKKVNIKELKDQEAEEYAALTVGWDITVGGKKPKLSKSKAEEVYKKWPWIVDQVKDAVEKKAAFTEV